ncbi:hypothetical protein PENTCL1PPCAC_25463, partial [Pristionchus entomophagus]
AAKSVNGKPLCDIFAIVVILTIEIAIAGYYLTASYPPAIHISFALMITCILILLLTEILDRIRLNLAPFNYAIRTFFFALVCGILLYMVLLLNTNDMGREIMPVSA